MHVLAADIGGSHITAGWVDIEIGEIRGESLLRRAVDSGAPKERILAAWLDVLTSYRPVAENVIAMAMPAPFDYKNGISLIQEQGKFRSLYGENIRNYLSEGLGIDPLNVRFANDAASFLEGEALSQLIPASERVLGITLGTGLGSAYRWQGIAKDAELWSSSFKSGIAEHYLGTEWFVRFAQQHGGVPVSGPKEFLDKEPVLAHEAFREYGKLLGEFIFNQYTQSYFDHVLIGGNISKAKSLFLPELRDYLAGYDVNVNISFSQLGERAALLGAASICTT